MFKSAPIWLVICVACNGVGSLAGQRQTNDNEKSGKGKQSEQDLGNQAPGNADDKADQPQEITGTYLTCSIITKPMIGRAVVGCNLNDPKTKGPIELKRLATSFRWSFLPPPGVPVDVSTEPQKPGAKWQIAFSAAARDESTLARALANMRIALDLMGLRAGNVGSSVQIASSLGDLLGGSVLDTTKQGAILPAPATSSSNGTANSNSLFPKLAGKRFAISCAVSADGSEYDTKETSFTENSTGKFISRTITAYDNAQCTGTPIRTQLSSPSTSPYYFVGETPVPNGIAITFDPAAQSGTFSIRMEGDDSDSSVSFVMN